MGLVLLKRLEGITKSFLVTLEACAKGASYAIHR
jgi:hypothetical protein